MKLFKELSALFLGIILCLQLTFGSVTVPSVHAEVTSGVWTYEVIKDGETDAVKVTKYKGTAKSLTIPSTIDGMSVREIGKDAFNGKKLTSVVIPEGVRSIGYTAFYDCSNLADITIPDTVDHIEAFAFLGTAWLEKMRDNNGRLVKVNGILVDGRTAAGQVNIPDDVHTIAPSAFQWCKDITDVTIPDSVTTIGDSVFEGCSGLKSITLSSGITRLGNNMFEGCENLTDINIPDGVTIIGDSAFQKCTGLKSVSLPASLTEICMAAFKYCSGLTSVSIPDKVTNIDDTAFASCSNLASVTIPASVSYIAPNAFDTSENVTITAPRGSTAIQYAMDKKMKCLYPDGADPYAEKEAEEKKKEEEARAAAEAEKKKKEEEARAAADQARRKKAAADAKAAENRISKRGAVKKFRVKSVKTARGKKTIKLRWKGISGMSGYQLQLSPKKKYRGKGVKTLTVKKTKTSCTVRGLKADKRYRIRIRPFVNYTDEKGSTVRLSGSWTEIRGRK